MIRLRQLLQEFEVGKLLWADPTSVPDRRKLFWNSYIARIYGDKTEPDTAEEREALDQIYQYISTVFTTGTTGFSVGVRTLPDPAGFVKNLLNLKHKFPEMLDPEHDINGGLRIGGDDWIFRGMTADVDMLVQAIEQTTKWETAALNYYNGWIGLVEPNMRVRSRAAGFMSFTTHGLRKASMFAQSSTLLTDRWPVIATVPYNSVKTRAVLTSSFIDALSGFDEGEIWVLEGSLKPAILYIRDPWLRVRDTMQSPAGKRIGAALQQNSTSPRFNAEFNW